MRRPFLRCSVVAAATVAVVLTGACDKDPATAPPFSLTATLASDSVIPRQGSIRVAFNSDLDPNTALNPSNFVVTNTCNGLPVAGSLRLSGDTIIFTPSQALPFLTALSVRVQGVLDLQQRPLPQPIILRLRTENPPVTDISWQQLTSPSGELLTGVTFLDPNLGWINTQSGAIYRTTDGGATFAALFKRADVASMKNLRAVSQDSLYAVASLNNGQNLSTNGLLRSIDGGLTFSTVFSQSPATMLSLSVQKVSGAAPIMVIGGSTSQLAAWRYDQQKDSLAQFGPVANSAFGLSAELSPNTANAVAVGDSSLAVGQRPTLGVAYRSVDGGRSYLAVDLPAATPILFGSGFINNTDAFLLGDSSTVLRLNIATGGLTALGSANGILQTTRDQTTGTATFYSYRKAAFAPDDPTIGWIIGVVTVRSPGQADVTRGIILITRDGGQNFTQQAIQGAGNNGLDFPPLLDINVLSKNFQAVVGASGFVAVRKSDTANLGGLCSFPAGS
jgi:photosystem II stability/assembly factor-like uncharacterized protein